MFVVVCCHRPRKQRGTFCCPEPPMTGIRKRTRREQHIRIRHKQHLDRTPSKGDRRASVCSLDRYPLPSTLYPQPCDRRFRAHLYVYPRPRCRVNAPRHQRNYSTHEQIESSVAPRKRHQIQGPFVVDVEADGTHVRQREEQPDLFCFVLVSIIRAAPEHMKQRGRERSNGLAFFVLLYLRIRRVRAVCLVKHHFFRRSSICLISVAGGQKDLVEAWHCVQTALYSKVQRPKSFFCISYTTSYYVAMSTLEET